MFDNDKIALGMFQQSLIDQSVLAAQAEENQRAMRSISEDVANAMTAFLEKQKNQPCEIPRQFPIQGTHSDMPRLLTEVNEHLKELLKR